MKAIRRSERVDRSEKGTKSSRGDNFRNLDQAGLIAGLRAENAGAFLEFTRRFEGLAFKYARSFDVPSEQEREWVSDVLTDVVLSLMKRGAILPDSLAAYIGRACRNKAYMDFRARSRREARELPPIDAAVVPPVDWEAERSSPVLMRLIAELEKHLTPDERRLLDWSSESVPLRLIAEWCGITRTGVSHRINRLRRRLQSLTPTIVSGFEPSERAEIARFLLRAKGASK